MSTTKPPSPASDTLGDEALRMILPVGRSGWAIAAGYLGLFSFLIVPAPLALLVSVIAIRHLQKHPDRRGLGRAVFGLVMGLVGSAALLFILIKRH